MKYKSLFIKVLLFSVLALLPVESTTFAANFDMSDLDTHAKIYQMSALSSDKSTQLEFITDLIGSRNMGVEYSNEVYKYSSAITAIKAYKASNGGTSTNAFISIVGTSTLYPVAKVSGSTIIPYTNPVITLNGEASINVPNMGTYTELGATAVDTRDGVATSNIATTGSVNAAIPGTYTVNYDLTDSIGKQATRVSRTIVVHEELSSIDTTSIGLVTYGTAASSIGLPSIVSIHTLYGTTVPANVSWDTSSYLATAIGTYSLPGTITLPAGVYNDNSISLSTTASVTVNGKLVSSTPAISAITKPNGTALSSLGLPTTVQVTLSDSSTPVVNVAWISSPEYTGATGSYTFTGTLSGFADGVLNTSDVKASVVVTILPTTTKDITSFIIPSQIGTSSIDNGAHTIGVAVLSGSDVTSLVASYSTNSVGSSPVFIGSTAQSSGVTANNFSSVVMYTVEAEDGSTQTWAVTVTQQTPVVDSGNAHILATSADDVIYVEGDFVSISDIKGVKLQSGASYADPSTYVVVSNSVYIFNMVNDGYIYVELQNGSEFKVALK